MWASLRNSTKIPRVQHQQAHQYLFTTKPCPLDDLVVLYTRGSYDLNGFPFISLVRFECDQKAVGNGPLEPVADGSKYFLIWKTKAACPYKRKQWVLLYPNLANSFL